MKSLNKSWFVLLPFVLAIQSTALIAEDAKLKELGAPSNEQNAVELYLGKTPEMTYLFWTGTGTITAHVTLTPTDKPDKFKATIVRFARFWKDNKKADYENRTTPQVKEIPFDDENGLRWTLLDGSKWKLGEEFTISKKDLVARVEAVPAYKMDGRNWFQKLGATNREEGLNAALKVADAVNSATKSIKDSKKK